MKKILYIILAIVLVSACAGNKEAKELFARVESVMDEHPDSALALLERAHINRARLSSDIEAKYALLYTMAQDKSGIDVDDDSLVRIAYDYYKDKTEDSLYAKSQYYMGKYFLFNDSTYAAEMCFNHAINGGKALKDYKTAYMACHQLSSSLALSNSLKALKIAKEGLAIQEKHDRKNIKNNIYMLINVARAIMNNDESKETFPYLDKAKERAYALGDSIIVSLVYRHLSSCYNMINMADSALYFAQKAYEYQSDKEESLELLCAISYFEADSILQAKQSFETIIRKSTTTNIKFVCFRYLSKIESMSGNSTRVAECIDSMYSNISLMYENAMQLRNEYYESTLQKEKDNTALIEKSKKKDIYIIIAVSVGLLVIFIITLLYIYSKKESKRKMLLEQHHHLLELQHQEEENRRERELEEQKHKLDMEAAEKRHQDEITMRELRLDIMRDGLLSKLAFMKKMAKTKDDNKAIKLTDEDWKEIEIFLNGVDDLFVERIKEEYPNLKEKDLQFCMLLRLKCSTQDLMKIYCINEQSVKQKKYKFKAKLGITDTQISAKQFISEY